MAVFAVISASPNSQLGERVLSVFENENFPFSSTVWFVSAVNVTPAQVCEKLGISPAGFKDSVVIRFEGYFGFATAALWQWLVLKGAAP